MLKLQNVYINFLKIIFKQEKNLLREISNKILFHINIIVSFIKLFNHNELNKQVL
jgi:hypothetical protein